MKVQSVLVSSLKVDPNNARKHSVVNLDAIKASLMRFGQQKPIVVDSSFVVRAGNGLLEAARQLGWEKVDVVVSPLQGNQMTAFAIADNRTSDLSTWDWDVLSAQLSSLQAGGGELCDAVGFTAMEINAILDKVDPQQDSADVDSIGEYKEEDEVYTIKVQGVGFHDKGGVLNCVKQALAASGYNYDCDCF